MKQSSLHLLDALVLVLTLLDHVAAWSPKKERHSDRHGPSHGYGHPRCHDASFIPDHILLLTYANISIGCQTRPSVLVNGSLPGPDLRLKPGKTSWIRVYNDMTDVNATVVSSPHAVCSLTQKLNYPSTGTVSVNAALYSLMELLPPVNGLSPRFTSSTTKSVQKQMTQDPTSIILTLAFRWRQHQDLSS